MSSSSASFNSGLLSDFASSAKGSIFPDSQQVTSQLYKNVTKIHTWNDLLLYPALSVPDGGYG